MKRENIGLFVLRQVPLMEEFSLEAWVNVRDNHILDIAVHKTPSPVPLGYTMEGQWHHIAYVHSPTEHRVYVDGIPNKRITVDGVPYRIRGRMRNRMFEAFAEPEITFTMEKVTNYEVLRSQISEPCGKCLGKHLMALLTDAKTHHVLKDLREDRKGLVALHVHSPTGLDSYLHGNHAIKLLTVYRDKQGFYRRLFTLASTTLEGAVNNAWKTVGQTGPL